MDLYLEEPGELKSRRARWKGCANRLPSTVQAAATLRFLRFCSGQACARSLRGSLLGLQCVVSFSGAWIRS